MKTHYRDRRAAARKQDFADKAARGALRDFRHGSQINGGCAEIYEAVAAAIRTAANAARDADEPERRAELGVMTDFLD